MDAHETLRTRIREQADAAGPDGWMAFPVPPDVRAGGELRVPRGAFERWAVSRAGGDHLAAPWVPISPSGLRLTNDDRYHSDWLLGSGLPLDAMSPGSPTCEALTDAAYAAMSDVSRRLLDHEATVLLDGPDVVGRVHRPVSPDDHPLPDEDGHPPVLVIRDASADYLELAVLALDGGGAVIVERGGQMAHLITVLREDGRGPIVRMPGALRRYPDGALLAVSPSFGRVQMRDDGRLSSGQGAMPAGLGAAPPVAPAPPARDGAETDPWALPAPGPEYDGPPATWPLRIVGEDEIRFIDAREAALRRRERDRNDPEPAPFALDRKDPERPHPADACGFMEPRASFEVRDLSIRVNAHKPAPRSDECYLEILLTETPTQRRATYYAPLRAWGPKGVRRAADRAIEAARELFAEPEPESGAGPAP